MVGRNRSKGEEIADAWQASAKHLLNRIFQKWSPSDRQSTESLCDDLSHFMMSLGSAHARVVFPDHSPPPVVLVGAARRVEFSKCITSSVPECSFYSQVSELISETLVQVLKGEATEEIPPSWRNTSPLVLGLSVFMVTRRCSINLGVKGWAELCLLVSSETAMDNKNLEELLGFFPHSQK